MSRTSYKYFDRDGTQPLMDEPNITLTWIVFFSGKIEEPILNIRDVKT